MGFTKVSNGSGFKLHRFCLGLEALFILFPPFMVGLSNGVNDEIPYPEDAPTKALRGIFRSLRAFIKFSLPEPKSIRIL